MKNQFLTPEVLDFLSTGERFLLTAARNFDGDAIGSLWALTLYLRSLGKQVTLANSFPLLPVYHFLSCSEEIVQDISGKEFDRIIVGDTASLDMVEDIYWQNKDLFHSTPLLNIDHHFAHCVFGSICFTDDTATSTCNLVYDLITKHAGTNEVITPEIATSLLLGIIYDTNCYKNANTKSADFYLSALLMEKGAHFYESIIEYYRKRNFSHFQIYGRVLSNLSVLCGGRVILGWVTQDLLREYGVGEHDMGNMFINDFLTSLDGDIFLLLTEVSTGGYKMSLRSKFLPFDVSGLAQRHFSGGGHKLSSGGTTQLSRAEIENTVAQYWEECKKQS